MSTKTPNLCLTAALLILLGGTSAQSANVSAVSATVLPDEASARDALEHAPAIIMAKELIAQGDATKRRLAAGSHEWDLAVTDRKRTERTGRSYTEQEFELSRAMRLPGKRSLDLELGKQLAENGEFAFEDAWHEAGRTLLGGWFNWLRAERMTFVRTELRDLQKSAVESVAKRVRSGDAPELEQRLAQSELLRTESELAQSRQAAQVARAQLLKEYPTLHPHLPSALPDPQPLEGTDAEWMDRVVKSNHEIKLADGRSAAANLAAQRARMERIADPTIGVIYSDNFDQNRNSIGVKITVPLGGRARSADAVMAASQARVAAADAQLATLRVTADGQQDLANRRAYFDQWVGLSGAARQAAENAAAYARGYSSGEFDLLTMLNAQQVAAQARLAAETAQLNALEADARLRIDAHQMWTADDDAD